MTRTNSRAWDVLLLGGPSGAGKTSVSYRLAHHFAVGITEVDDFQVIMERMTTPEQYPPLHIWKTQPEVHEWPPERIWRQIIDIGRVMHPAMEAVIANHLETQKPMVLEGDFLLPAMATQESYGDEVNNGRVRGVFLYEDDVEQLVKNFSLREPDGGLQTKRAQVSYLYGQWLVAECARLNLPCLPARPWETVFERILEKLV
jgi:2-phosphoglycerate kinase